MSLEKELAEALTPAKTEPYDTEATVRRIEGGTAWVHIPGGVDETPVALTINAQAGDTVRVRISGGSAWIVGNDTAPPTDDTTAADAQETANTAQTTAEAAQTAADAAETAATAAQTAAEQAETIANNTAQHFWFEETGTDTGAHIAEVTQDEWSDPSDPNYHSGANLLARSNGIAIRDGMDELATFGTSGSRIGSTDESHLLQDFNSLQLVDKEGTTYFHVSDLRNADGSLTENFTGDSTTYMFTVTLDVVSVISVKVLGEDATYTRSGRNFTITPTPIIGEPVEITYIPASNMLKTYTLGTRSTGLRPGIMSYAEGLNVNAAGDVSHAEGCYTYATASYSHAEGYHTSATGIAAHAEGGFTNAGPNYSHAEGYYTSANYNYSHASGLNVRTYDEAQTAIGRYNTYEADKAFIIGNGTGESNMSNAFTVGWNGTATAYGNAIVNRKNGTSSSAGSSILTIGNSSLKSVDGNSYGALRLYSMTEGSTQTYYVTLLASGQTAHRNLYLKHNAAADNVVKPNGTTAVGSGTNPVYVTAAGTVTASTSDVGGSARPVYLKDGVMTAMSDWFDQSVKSTAKPTFKGLTTSGYIDGSTNTGIGLRAYSSSQANFSCGLSFDSKNYANSAYAQMRASAFNVQSSRLVKENIHEMSDEEALKLLDISVVDFDYIAAAGGEKGQHGVIAEDVLSVIPSAVTIPEGYDENSDDILNTPGVDYSKFVPHLIKMVQIQAKQIERLEAQLEGGKA